MQKRHFHDLSELHEFLGLKKPEHPLFSVSRMEAITKDTPLECVNPEFSISSDCYSISLKHVISGEIAYGRTQYDYKNGAMICVAPRQEVMNSRVKTKSTARLIIVHEDFIRNHPLKDAIKKYHYFSYAVNEALHLSPKEENMIATLFDQIEQEYHNNPDAFSKELILSQLSTLLQYANRFYHRQFLHRQEMTTGLLNRFLTTIDSYTNLQGANAQRSALQTETTIPTIEEIADQLAMTPRYLSDALKVETGKTAIENLHFHVIDQAKDMLLQPNTSVAEVAYKLGFEYPQYFSRLFKKKVGMTPTEYRKSYH